MVTLIIDSCCDFVRTSDLTPRAGLNYNIQKSAQLICTIIMYVIHNIIFYNIK